MKTYIEENPPVNFFRYLTGIFRSGENFPNVLFTSRGRDAIQLAIKFLHIEEKDSVLLPALTCDTVTSVFSGKCCTAFYDLREDYSIDLSVLEDCFIKNPKIKILYVIHYFGFIQSNIQEISHLCKRYDVLLVEDHAHSALSKYDQDLADIHIYSFRKLIPTADGGGIHIKGAGVQKKFSINQLMRANIKGLAIATKRIASLYSLRIRALMGKLIQNDIDRLDKGNSQINPLPVSKFGCGVIRSADIEKICTIRRENYLKWKTLFVSTPFEPVFPDLDNGTVPFGFPMKLKNNEELVSYFRTYNIFLKINWLTLPLLTEKSCPVSHCLAHTSITLPVYPGLKEKDMHFIRDKFLKHGVPIY